MRQLVEYVAALSAQRIVSPLWTVLRPITGSTFTSDITDGLRSLEGIVDWLDYGDQLEDQVLRFSHPVVAQAYLRSQGILGVKDQIETLRPVLAGLTQKPGDVWVAETLTTAIFPPRPEFPNAEWDWIIDTIQRLPALVRDNSKVILHQWGRALYQSADPRSRGDLEPAQREGRIREAAQHLERAVELPRRPGRDETPSNLLNSLGTAYARLAQTLRDMHADPSLEADAWTKAAAAFDRSIQMSGGLNMEALLAFSERLIEHAQNLKFSDRSGALRDTIQAHSVLDEAEDLEQQAESPDPSWHDSIANSRRKALALVDEDLGQRFIDELKQGPDRELGVVLEARSAVERTPGEAGLERGLQILDDAEVDRDRLGPRAAQLRLRLMQKHPTRRYDFGSLAELYGDLEVTGWQSKSMVDEFRHAVTCYQAGEFGRGTELFRRLRERARQSSNAPLRMRDFWRDESDPSKPRSTYVRVDRIQGEWRADGFVQDLRQTVPLRPRHFSPAPKVNEVVSCGIQFETNGPLAVPLRFITKRPSDA
jgi:hypothetical protein